MGRGGGYNVSNQVRFTFVPAWPGPDKTAFDALIGIDLGNNVAFILYIIVVVTFVNIYSVRLSATFFTWLSSVKILIFVFIISLGVWKLIERGMCVCVCVPAGRIDQSTTILRIN
jgi:amino acid transporter